MLSIQFIRENPDLVRAAMQRRRENVPIDEIIELDGSRRQLLTDVEALRARRNDVSREIGRLKGDLAAIERVRGEMRTVGEQITSIEAEIADIDGRLRDRLLEVPNVLDESVPDGESEDDNVIVEAWGLPRTLPFSARAHWDLGPALDGIDFERGVKLSGSRFYLLRGAFARLQRGLINWLIDLHVRDHGYVEMNVPYLVKREALVGSAQLPKFEGNLYHDEQSDLWLIPTAEVALANIYADEIIDPGRLPISMVAYTACFRREQAASGRDTRGIKRGFQFDKVEMFKIVEPEAEFAALADLVSHASDCLRKLDLPHRVKLLCSADTGFHSAKTFDIDVWSPGVAEWLEVSSCSTVRDFQSRRAGLRYRRALGARTEFPYELNGSGLGIPRTMIAIVENYQRADGSIEIPEVLRPYVGMDEIVFPEAAVPA